MNEFFKQVKEAKAPFGTAVLWRLGQMGLLIKMGDSLLCVDYYASEDPGRLFAPPVPAGEVEGITAFLGTHNHLDHIDHASWRIWARTCPDALFLFPAAHREDVLADGVEEGHCRGLNDGDSCSFGGITVRAVAAAHEFIDRDPETGLCPYLQYIIEGNGLRIHHAGDTLRYEGLRPRLASFGPLDVQMLPINGRDGKRYRRNCIGNMTFQEAADLAGELNPGLVIPGHWDLFADNPGDPEAFADYLDAKYEGRVPCACPGRLEPLVITARN